jgi:hypothetical protein
MPKRYDSPISGVREEPDTNSEPQKNDGVMRVDYTTKKGERLLFDSFEDFEEYIDSLVEEGEQDDGKEPRNFWNYRVLEEIEDGVSSFSIIEVHYEDGKIWGYIDSDNNILSHWDNYNDLKVTWELVKGAFEHPKVKKDKDGFLYESEKEEKTNEPRE